MVKLKSKRNAFVFVENHKKLSIFASKITCTFFNLPFRQIYISTPCIKWRWNSYWILLSAISLRKGKNNYIYFIGFILSFYSFICLIFLLDLRPTFGLSQSSKRAVAKRLPVFSGFDFILNSYFILVIAIIVRKKCIRFYLFVRNTKWIILVLI